MLYFIIFTVLYGLVPFLLLVFAVKKKKKIGSILPFTLVVFIASIYEFVASILLKINVENWFFIYAFTAFYSILYFYYILNPKEKKNIFLVIATLFLLVFVVSFYHKFSVSFLVISSFFNVYQTLIVFLFSILWFKKIFEDLEFDNLFNSPDFYFISGLLLYYCGSVVLFLLANDIYATDQANFQYYWLLNVILNFILRTLLIVGIWKAQRE